MPTKRSAGLGRIGDLSPAMVDVILTGTSERDPFLRFEVDLREDGGYLGRLYTENQAALDAEFRRRGLPGKPWVVGG